MRRNWRKGLSMVKFDTGVLQTKINEKLGALEAQYAPDLAGVKTSLAEIAKTIVDLGNITYTINGILKVKDKIVLQNGRINFLSETGQLYLYGNASLRNLTIDSGSFIKWGGAIALINTNGVILDGVTVLGNQRGEAVFCNSKASNTVIKNCYFPDTGWGILFNDGSSRLADGVDYTGQSIGSGLIISDCVFGKSDKTTDGDAVEINTPNLRFSDIVVKNCKALKTTSIDSNNGIGFGFAHCDNVLCEGNTLKNIVGTGSLHFEWCSNVKANNNSIYDSQYGIVFQAGNDHVFENNSVYRCDYGFFCMYNGVDTQSFAKLLNNYLDGLKQYGILVQNAKYIDVIGNTIINYTGQLNTAIISFQETNGKGVTFSKIKSNRFILGTGTARPANPNISLSTLSTDNEVEDNYFEGYNSYDISIDLTKNKLVNYIRGNKVGLTVHSKGDPTGYYPSTTSSLAVDTTTGFLYRGTGVGNGWTKIL
jgi:nitrous oxidase accessory protein NosD